MNLSGILNDALSGETVSQISQQLGTDEGTTNNAIQAALPMLLGAFANHGSTEEGAASLQGMVDQHGGGLLGNLAGLLGSGALGSGAGILGQVLGGAQGDAEQHVSQASGLDMSKVGPLLAMLAPVVLGAINQHQSQSGDATAPGGDLAGMLGGAAQQMGAGSPLMGILGQVLDRNHDGSAVDDVVGMIGGFLGGRK